MFEATKGRGGWLQGYVELVPSELAEHFGDPELFECDKYLEWFHLEDDEGFVQLYTKYSHPAFSSDRLHRFHAGGVNHEDLLRLVEELEAEGLTVGDVSLQGVDVSQETWEATEQAHAEVASMYGSLR